MMNEREIFIGALQEDSLAARQAYLDNACGSNAELRRRVEGLLRDCDKAAAFLHSPAPMLVATADDPMSERPGTVIGPYKLMEQIGEGGFGLVFIAEQQQPVRRKVALKVIKPGMDSKQVIARFEAERQALALMDHPHIAKVFDGGTTPSGRPYFVMELVKGLPITAYCDQKRLTAQQRLELFVDICRAVQHAHQKGIIHRDLKPSNILVAVHDVTPVVKAIDFGIAKATGQQLTDKTLYTQAAQLVGTPLYMSPEQAGSSSLDVDTRSDVYSLGVLLYELLTGTTPFESETLRKADHDEMRRIIREEEPPRPSTRLSTLQQAALSTIAACRAAEPGKLRQQVRGELDWVVMRCLEKDRGRRYDSAGALADDIGRYLADEPLQASPPSAGYKLRKLARKHKKALATASVFVVLLAALGGGVGWMLNDRAARQREADAKVREAESRVEEALQEAKPGLQDGNPQDRALIAAAQRVHALLDSAVIGPEVQQRAEQFLRDVRMLGELEEIHLRLADTQDKDSLGRVGMMFDYSGTEARYAELFPRYGLDVFVLDPAEAAARIRSSAIREALLVGLYDWIANLNEWPRAMEAQPKQKRLVRIRQVAEAADDNAWRRVFLEAALAKDVPKMKALMEQRQALEQPGAVLGWVGLVLFHTRLLGTETAEALLRQAQHRHPADFWINYFLGWASMAQPAEAVSYCRAAVAIRPRSAEAFQQLGFALMAKGDLDAAVATLQHALVVEPHYVVALNSLAWLLATCPDPKLRDVPRAVTLAKKAVALAPNDGDHWNTLGVAYYRAGSWKAAVQALLRSDELRQGKLLSSNAFFLAMAHWQLGEKDKARDWYTKAVAWMDKHQLPDAELKRFRAEAAQLLGRTNPPPAKEKPASKP